MYRPTDRSQHSFLDFTQPMGRHMNPDNQWVKMADSTPWDEYEIKYAGLFSSGTGNVTKPLRMVLVRSSSRRSPSTLTGRSWNRLRRIRTCSTSWGCPAIRSRPLSMPAHWCCSVNASPWRWSWRQMNSCLPGRMTAKGRLPEVLTEKAGQESVSGICEVQEAYGNESEGSNP